MRLLGVRRPQRRASLVVRDAQAAALLHGRDPGAKGLAERGAVASVAALHHFSLAAPDLEHERPARRRGALAVGIEDPQLADTEVDVADLGVEVVLVRRGRADDLDGEPRRGVVVLPDTQLFHRVEVGRGGLDQADVGVDADAGVPRVPAAGEVAGHEDVAPGARGPRGDDRLQQLDDSVVERRLGRVVVLEQELVAASFDVVDEPHPRQGRLGESGGTIRSGGHRETIAAEPRTPSTRRVARR